MRAPDDLPRRPRRGTTRRRRGRTFVIVGAVGLVVLLTSLRGIARFYTDYLWYDSLDQADVWRTVLGTRVALATVFVGAFFALAWGNLTMADRLAPPYRVAGPEDELLERYHDLVAPRARWIRVVVAAVLALVAGSGVSSEWNSWVLFRNGGDFGSSDRQFGVDAGFYVFRLPFLSFLVDWLFASLLIVLIVTIVAHYLNGGIRVQPPSPRVTPQVKAHVSVLLAALALVKAVDYWLQRYELTVSSRGVVDGATYTDVKAQLPALNLLVLISVAAAVLLVANIFRRGWALPMLAVGLWVFVAVVAGGIYPQVVQSFQVRPNESAKERPYIERNIDATLDALDLGQVEVRRFTPDTDTSAVDLSGAGPTVRNIRLWDPAASLSGQTFEQLQRIRNYYSIDDIDVDRYPVGGELTQVNIGPRSINPDGVPGDSWEARHLAYTHGYGVVLAPSNATVSSEPDFLVGNIPPEIARPLSESGFELTQPRMYFGEDLDGYVVVGTDRPEIDFQGKDNETQTTRYKGDDGVAVDSVVRRAAFALRFGDLNPLISDFMTDESRVVFRRDVVDRVQALAPFLDADADPYPVVVGGKVTWMVDLYTTTDRYPYAQQADTDQLASGSGLDHDFNYVRNSVKATVDAYDGTVRLYVVDDDDPIIQAYVDAFPDLFTDGDRMPEAVRGHVRYPEDLFRVQTAAYGRYHLRDPDAFFDQDDAWRVARDPGTAGADPVTQVTDEQGQLTGEQRAPRIAPYYQLLQLPREDSGAPSSRPEMVMMRPFVPYSEDDSNQLLTAFMAARMDGDNYGQLVVYELSAQELPPGPGIAAASISADEDVSVLRNRLGTGGSEVRFGNLLLVPIGNALLYVQPFYVVGEGRDLPLLQQVIVTYGDEVVIEQTLSGALTSLFGQQAVTREQPDEPGPEGGATPPSTGQGGAGPEAPAGAAEQAGQLLEEANRLFAQADEALRSGDLATYEDRVGEARARVADAVEVLGADDAGESSGDDGTTTTEGTTGT